MTTAVLIILAVVAALSALWLLRRAARRSNTQIHRINHRR